MTQRPQNDTDENMKRAAASNRQAEENAEDSAEESVTLKNREDSHAASTTDKKAKKSEKTTHEEQLRSENAELKDRYVRLLAEYDNYRKRTQKERDSLYSDAVAEVTREWLPVMDNVERAMCFSTGDSNEAAQKVAEGVKLIHRQIQEVFAKLGIEEIVCAEGVCFDPNLHEAVLHIEDDGLGEHCIAEVFQKGYRIADRILRHSVVKVAN